jgi:glycosyltransferase involved in cell wall biosynthesis
VAWLVKRVSTGFVANGQMIADDLKREGIAPSRIVGLSNGVEVLPARALADALPKRWGGRFVYAGRLVPDKRIEVLIQAAARLDPKQRWSLTIVGVGAEYARLQAMASELGVDSRVVFAGQRDDVPRFLLDYDAFVSASPREGQSNALLEAIAAGLIPICVRASGVEDLLAEGRGLIAEAPDPDEIARLMNQVLAESLEARRAWQLRLHAYAREALSIDAVAARTLSLFIPDAAPGPPAVRD